MSTAAEALADLKRLLDELRRRISAVETVSREVAEALALIARLQERAITILGKILGKLEEHSSILEKHSRILEQHSQLLKEHSKILREHSDKLSRLEEDVRAIRITVERIAGTLEEEACDLAMQAVADATGKHVSLSRLVIEGVAEVDIYGTTDDLCVLGEVKTRAGPSALRALCRALLRLYQTRRDLLRDKVILLVCGLRVLDVVKREAEKRGIGILTTRGILVRPRMLSLESAVETCERLLEELRSHADE